MTHSYRIELRVEEFNPNKKTKIAKALKYKWGWDKKYTIVSGDEIYLTGDDNLSGSYDDFFVELKETIYEVNGGCCNVNIDIYDLETAPIDSYTARCGEEEESGGVAQASGFEHLAASDVLEASFKGWGYREMSLAAKLLEAYSDNPQVLEGSDISVGFNPNSGYVFLNDEDYNTAMMNGNKIEKWYSCQGCGHEGFLDDMAHEPGDKHCVQYMREIGVPEIEIKKMTDDGETEDIGFEHLGAARALPKSAECQTCGAIIKPRWSESEQAMSLWSGIRKHYWDEHRGKMLKGVRQRYAATFMEQRCSACLGKMKRHEPYVQCETCSTYFHPRCARRVGKCPRCTDIISSLPSRYWGMGVGTGFEHLGSSFYDNPYYPEILKKSRGG